MYTVHFYQAAVTGFEPERYPTIKLANIAAVEFLTSFDHINGLQYVGSIYRDKTASIVDRSGYTEARAWIEGTPC